MKKFLKKRFFGKKKYQLFFSRLFDISLQGLNIGTGGRHPKDSGEIFALRYALSKIREKENLVVFDGGAQVGIYTECVLETLRSKDKTGTVYGFEPAGCEYKMYTDKFSGYGNVVPCRVALGNRDEKTQLYSPKNSTGLGSLHTNSKNLEFMEDVKIMTIDNFCRDKKIQKIHLLKLDVEGNELDALRGAHKMLAGGHIDFIQFEFSVCSLHAKTSFRNIYDTLDDNYKIYRILCDGLEEIRNPGTREECFFTTNYLAERKTT